jgi:hypothetical protein
MYPPVHPNRPNRPSLFIGHQVPPTRVPRVVAVVPRVADARVCRPPCATAARVHRPPCAVAALVHRHLPIIDHAHSPLTLTGVGPPSSPAIDRSHRICVLRTADFARSRLVGDLLPQIHQVSPLHRQAAHSTMSPHIHRVTRSPPSRPTSSMGGPTPQDTLTTYEADITARRAAFQSMGVPPPQDAQRSLLRWIPFTDGNY